MVLAPTASENETTKAAANQRRETRRLAAERRRELEPLRRALKEAERTVSDLSARKTALDHRIADPATYAGAADVAGLLREQASLAAALGEAEARWLTAAEAIEDADAE
jgi:ATP-binding cassette subfamily F protein 3